MAGASESPNPQPGAAPPSEPSPGEQLRAWSSIGTQSLGGGSATLYLMRKILVVRKRWLTEAEFLEDWTLSRLSPGVHLIALTALLGRRIGRRRGIALSLGGLLIPAALITAALTGAFDLLESQPAVRAALDGMGPVTIGMMIGLTAILARSAVRAGPVVIFDLALLTVAVLVGFLGPASPIIVIIGGGVIGALFLGQDTPPDTPVDE